MKKEKDVSVEGKILIYKDFSYDRAVHVYVGKIISKRKTYKIEPIKSGHFNGYKQYVQPNCVIAILDKEDAKIMEVMKMVEDIKKKKGNFSLKKEK